MAEEKPKRVDIGFQGGQVLQVRVLEAAHEAMRAALADGHAERWHQLATEDSEIAIDLAQVVYVRLETERHKVGF